MFGQPCNESGNRYMTIQKLYNAKHLYAIIILNGIMENGQESKSQCNIYIITSKDTEPNRMKCMLCAVKLRNSLKYIKRKQFNICTFMWN